MKKDLLCLGLQWSCGQTAELSEEDEEEDVSLSSSLEALSAFDSSAKTKQLLLRTSRKGSGPRRPLRPSFLPQRGQRARQKRNVTVIFFRFCRVAGVSSSACSASKHHKTPVPCHCWNGLYLPRLLSLGLRLLQSVTSWKFNMATKNCLKN